jgi:hypothetical protein
MFPEAFGAASYEISSPGDSYLFNTKVRKLSIPSAASFLLNLSL